MNASMRNRIGWIIGWGLLSACTAQADTVIDHAALAAATNPPAGISAKVGQLRWFFSHASVG